MNTINNPGNTPEVPPHEEPGNTPSWDPSVSTPCEPLDLSFPADDNWDDEPLVDTPIKRWVPDVRPDWWTDEMEAEDLAGWEADQAEGMLDVELDQSYEYDHSGDFNEPPAYKRHPEASILQKFHQLDYNHGPMAPHVTPWDQHINKFNAARNPLMPLDREEGRYMKEVKKNQPHRHVCGHVADPDYQPIPTYGQLMLPESYDPITNDGLPDPGFARLTWSPDTPAREVIQGAARDLADVGSTFAARLRVSIGHEADADTIDKFHKLAVAMKNLHTIINVGVPKPRKNAGARPRKNGRKRTTAKLTIEIETLSKKETAENDTKHLAEPQPTRLNSTKTSATGKMPAHAGPICVSAQKPDTLKVSVE